MGNVLIDDPVLDQILASGEFDSCLRSGCGGTSGSALAAFLVGRYFGLTEAGGSMLATYIEQARTAGGVLMSLQPGQQLPLDAIPIIPGIGGPSIDGGRIAAITHLVWDDPSRDGMTGWDYTMTLANEPTYADWQNVWENTLAILYVHIPDDDSGDPRISQPPLETVVFGVYRSY